MPRMELVLTYWNRWFSSKLILRKARDAPESPASSPRTTSSGRPSNLDCFPTDFSPAFYVFPEIQTDCSLASTTQIQATRSQIGDQSSLLLRSGRAGVSHTDRTPIVISQYLLGIGGGGSGGW